MAFDTHKNLAISAVVTAPTPATSGTSLTVTAGEGVRFPAAPFNATVWPATAMPTPANGEVIRVTARATDALTITRAQEGSTARPIGTGDLIAATITAKTLTDLETQAALKDAANVFTASPQTIQQTPPTLALIDPSQPVDARRWLLLTAGGVYVQPALDAGPGAINTLGLTRLGDAHVHRDLYEKGRATPLGHWITDDAVAYAWSVGFTGPVRWALLGKTMCLSITAAGTVPAGGAHRFTLPLSAASAGALVVPASVMAPGQSAWRWGTAQFTAAGTWLEVFQLDNVAWPAGPTSVQLAVTFPIL